MADIQSLALVFVAVLVTVIMLFSVTQPITNDALKGNGTCQPGATCAWNQSGYPGALAVSQQLPTLYVLLIVVAIAGAVISFVRY